MAELTAKIGADASELVKETKRGRAAFGRFTTSIEKDSAKAEKSVTGLGKAIRGAAKVSRTAGSISGTLGKSFRSISTLAGSAAASVKGLAVGIGGALVKGASVAATIVTSVGKAVLSIGSAALSAVKSVISLGVGLAKLVGSGIVGALKTTASLLKSVALGAAAAAVALGAALVAAAGKGIKAFAEFQTQFAQVSTLLVDATPPQLKKLEGSIRSLAVRFGSDLQSATKAAYDTISAGVTDPIKAVELLETAFTISSAGATDVATATDLLTTSLNAFGKDASQAAQVSDVLFATIRVGKTDAAQLAASLGQVAPIASAAGITFEDMSAALGTLTASGLSTAEASTALKSAISGIIKPTGDAEKALRSIGVGAKLLTQKGGLEKAFERIKKASGGTAKGLVKLLPDIRAMGAAAVLAGKGFSSFQASLQATNNAAGSTAEAFEKTQNALGNVFRRLRAQVTDVFISIGEAFEPAVRSVLSGAAEIAKSLGSAFKDAGSPIRQVLASIGENIVGLISAFGGLAAGAAGPIQIIQNLLAGLNSVLITARTFVTQYSDTIRASIGSAAAFVTSAITGIGTAVTAVAGFLRANADSIRGAFDTIKGVVATVVSAAGSAIQLIVANRAAITDFFKATGVAINGALTFVKTTIGEITNLARIVAERFPKIRKLLEIVSASFRGIGNAAQDGRGLVTSALDVIARGLNEVSATLRRAADPIAEFFTAFKIGANLVKIAFLGMRVGLGGIITAFSKATQAITSLAAKAAEAVGDKGLAKRFKEASEAAGDFGDTIAEEVNKSNDSLTKLLKETADVGGIFDAFRQKVLGAAQEIGKAAGEVEGLSKELLELNKTSAAAANEVDKAAESQKDFASKVRETNKELEKQNKIQAKPKVSKDTRRSGGTTKDPGRIGLGIGSGRAGFSIGSARQSQAGESAFGFGRVTPSSSLSGREAKAAAALRLGPKAFQSALRRSGSLDALLRSRGLDPKKFVRGGPVDETSSILAEAGEFVLSGKGVNSLGKLFADLVNKGGSQLSQSITNNFSVASPESEGFDNRAVAMALRPAILRAGSLAASRSPIL